MVTKVVCFKDGGYDCAQGERFDALRKGSTTKF
jgi:hypothetical protein